MPQIPVLVCHRQPLIRASLRAFFERSDEVRVVGETGNAGYAAELAHKVGAAIVVMDFYPQEAERLGATYRPGGTGPEPRMVALSDSSEPDILLSAIRLGARAILSTESDTQDTINAIKAAASGHAWLPPEITGQLLDLLAPPLTATRATGTWVTPALTPREREIVRLLVGGATNNDMAKQLQLSNATVRSHVHHAMGKLGLSDRAQLVAYAYQQGIVSLLPQSNGHAADGANTS